jgi:hypothetical protein
MIDDVSLPRASADEVKGVKHAVAVAVEVDPGYAEEYAHDEKWDLTLVIRISDHARESQFYGDVPLFLDRVSITKGSSSMKIWQDARCHQKRGRPKVTVVRIDGRPTSGASERNRSARPRRIGLRVPPDEIMQEQALPGGKDQGGQFLLFRTRTQRSYLIVDIKLYIQECDLSS